jgi:alpha-glucosidase
MHIIWLFLALLGCRQNEYRGYEVKENEIIISTTGSLKLQVDLVSSDVARIWLANTLKKDPSFAVDKESWNRVPYTVDDLPSYLRIKTKDLSIRIAKSTLAVDFYLEDDKTPISLSDISHESWSFGKPYVYRELKDSEHFYGLGQDNQEYLGTLDRRGTTRALWTGQKISRGRVTADIPIPFFLSTGAEGGGYGMFFDNSYYTEFDLGNTSPSYYSWKANGGEFLYYFFKGPEFKTILDRYTALTGRPSMPNSWTLGFMQSKCAYQTWDEIDNVVKTMKDKDIPLTGMAIDFDWAEQLQNYKWHPRWKGQSAERMKGYAQQGIKFLLSQSGPMIQKTSSIYDEGLKRGVFATDGKGNTVTCGYYGGDLLDFTSPSIEDWLWSHISHLYDEGVGGWWLDLTEPEDEPPQTIYQGGPAAKIHNVFSLLSSKAYYHMQTTYDATTRPFILTRTGFAGIQKYGVAMWTGDIYSDYETFAAQIPALLNSSMSGIPYWTNDSGGFLSGYYKDNLIDHGLLYERWLQFSVFAPITRAHHVGLAEPYAFGPEVEAGAKNYLKLRSSLLPYIYSHYQETYKTGMPLVRPLILEYQKDPNVINLKDEFLFGKYLLVAPIITEKTVSRSVYLPEGTWFALEDDLEYQGGQTYLVQADQHKIPVFVKAGAIIPKTQGEDIALDIYPIQESKFTLYQDDESRTPKFTETEIVVTKEKIEIHQSNKLLTPKAYIIRNHLKNKIVEYRIDTDDKLDYYLGLTTQAG